MATERENRAAKNQGMNWLRPEKRLAIYLRDGLACVWCGEAIEQGAKLTLDHLRPYSLGGSNDATNLVTACHRCNSSRGNRSVAQFARACAAYLDHGIEPRAITAHIRATAQRPLDVRQAKEIIAQRGGWTAALHNPTPNPPGFGPAEGDRHGYPKAIGRRPRSRT